MCRGRFAKDQVIPARSATTGSIFIARRAGNQQAAMATAISNNETTIKASGSVEVTPNSGLEPARPSTVLQSAQASIGQALFDRRPSPTTTS